LSTTARNIIFTDIAGTQFVVNMNTSVAPTVDMMNIINTAASQGTITTAVDGLQIDFATAGTTSSADNSGLRINVTSNNSGATTTLEGLFVANLSSAETNSTETGLKIGTGWDYGLDVANTALIGSSGNTFTFDPTSGPLFAGTARPTKTIVLSPEYPGAILTASGSATITGSMTSDASGADLKKFIVRKIGY